MKKTRLLITILLALSTNFTLRASQLDATENTMAYFAFLLEQTVIGDEHLLRFADDLANGKLECPITKEEAAVSIPRAIHRQQILQNFKVEHELDKLLKWAEKTLAKRGHDRKKREKTSEETRSLRLKDSATSIATGGSHTCAIKGDQTVQCWGSDQDSEGNFVGQSSPPADLGPVLALATGKDHSCAIKMDHTVQCWGSDKDPEGNFSGQSSPPSDLGPVLDLAAGPHRTCAIKMDQTMQCWGWNVYGQSSPPADLGPVQAIAAGRFHTCAIKMDQTVQCWGNDYAGQSSPPAGFKAYAALGAKEEL